MPAPLCKFFTVVVNLLFISFSFLCPFRCVQFIRDTREAHARCDAPAAPPRPRDGGPRKRSLAGQCEGV